MMKKLLALAVLSLAASAASADDIVLTGTVRDHAPGPLVPGVSNPDFESGIGGLQTGLVGSTLTGSAPTPLLFGAPGYITSAASFAEWYGAAAPSMPYAITLSEMVPGSGIYSFTSGAFFPIDGMLLGNYGSSGHNYHFTYQIHATFGYTPGAGQVFSFSGDDDVWVYFDKELGIDLGGVHGSTGATIAMDTFFAGKPAGNYDFDFFFAERHTTESNFRIETSLNLTTPPIPEPETYALMVAGLGMVGFMARRRRKV